jgi:ABC-2 type transport system ATP-binding protein
MQVICLDRVSLWRRTQEEFSYDLKRTILSLFEGKFRKPSKHLVLDQVNLVIESGQKVGIIGANGAGKSTLLKLICGILQPETGRIKVWGRIAPLIELEAGFEPEISVVDNIVLYGVLLGFSRQDMMRRISSILEFAGLEEYAFLPVKALSSGMVARLGFAIATDVQPDILILDEVLSVGDESFKSKCRQRIQNFWRSNTTVLLVSHDLEFVQQECDQAIWLDRGKVKLQGDAKTVVRQYLYSINQNIDLPASDWNVGVQEALYQGMMNGSVL